MDFHGHRHCKLVCLVVLKAQLRFFFLLYYLHYSLVKDVHSNLQKVREVEVMEVLF